MFLLYIALLPGLCSSEPDEAIFQLVADLLQHYRSRCSTLLFSWPESDFETTQQLISLTRHLSRRGIMALTLDFQEYLLYRGDLSCSLNVIQTFDFKTTSFLRKASESNKLSRSRWLLLPNPATDNDFSSLAGVHIPFDCEFIVTQRAGANVHLTEVYRVSEATSLRSEHYGTWSRVTGLRGIPHKRLYCRRDNLEGLNLLGVTSNSSSTLVYPGKDKKVKSIGGFFGALWSLLEERINFTTTFSTPEDDAWGSLESNGSWNGMIGMLQRSQAQVAVTMFSMTLQRKDVVDFTVPITLMRYAMYIQEKTLMKPNWMSFFAPFGQMLWITIIITIATMVAFLAAMGHWLGTSSIGHMDSLFIVFTVFTQQAPHPPLKPLSGSVAILTAQLTVLVLMAAYSGTLISFLTVRKIFMPFTDLAGFLKDGSYQLGVIEKTSEYDYFANNTDETMHKIYERLMKPNAENIVRSELDGLHRVCSARYAFLSSTYFMIEPLKQRNCSIIAVPIGTFQVPVAIIMNKASPYRELLDHNLQIMRRVGILKRLQLALSPKSTSPASESAIDVHLGHVMPLFFMLISGLITAVIVFCVEQGITMAKTIRKKKAGACSLL